MESAGADPLRAALTQQGVMIGQQATRLNAAARELGSLNVQVAELTTRLEQLQVARAPDLRDPEPHANNPPVYDGDPSSCQAFLSQCALVFALQPRRYASEGTKVAYVLTLLAGRAREWGVAVWNANAPFCANFEEFRQEMVKLFDRSARGDEAAALLSRLTQKGGSVTDYAIRLKTLAAACDWNESAIRARFLEGLNHTISDEMSALDMPADLESLINLALRVESRLNRRQQRRLTNPLWRSRSSLVSEAPLTPASAPEPMQLGRLRLTPQQKQLRLAQGLCLYCGKAGHFALHCPAKVKAHQ